MRDREESEENNMALYMHAEQDRPLPKVWQPWYMEGETGGGGRAEGGGKELPSRHHREHRVRARHALPRHPHHADTRRSPERCSGGDSEEEIIVVDSSPPCPGVPAAPPHILTGASPSHSPHLPCHSPSLAHPHQTHSVHSPSIQPLAAHSPSLLQPLPAHSPLPAHPPHLYNLSYASFPTDPDAPLDMSLKRRCRASPSPSPPPHRSSPPQPTGPPPSYLAGRPSVITCGGSSSPDRRYYSPHHYSAPSSPSPPPPLPQHHHYLHTAEPRPASAEDGGYRIHHLHQPPPPPPPPPSYSVATAHLREKRAAGAGVPSGSDNANNNNNNIATSNRNNNPSDRNSNISNRNGPDKSDSSRRQIVVNRSVTGAGDPEIDEHFRRSLGKTYHHIFDAAASADPAPAVVPAAPAGAAPARDVRHKKQVPPQQPPAPQPQPQRQSPSTPPRVPSTDSVDDHFAKALGATWAELQALRNNTPPPPPSYSSSTAARGPNTHPAPYSQPHGRASNSDTYSSMYKTSPANGILRPSAVSSGRFNGSLAGPTTCGPTSSSPVSSLATLSIVPIGRSSSRSSSPSVTSPATITRVVSSSRSENEANARVLQSFRPESEVNARVSPPSWSESEANSHFISTTLAEGDPVNRVLPTSRPESNASNSNDRHAETDHTPEYSKQTLKVRSSTGTLHASRPSSPEYSAATSKTSASSPPRTTANSCTPAPLVNESIKASPSVAEVNDHGANISEEKPKPMST